MGCRTGYLQHPDWSFVTGYPVVRPVCTDIRGGLATIDFVNHISRTSLPDYFGAAGFWFVWRNRQLLCADPFKRVRVLSNAIRKISTNEARKIIPKITPKNKLSLA